MLSPQKTNFSFLSIPVFLFAFFVALSFVFVVSPAPARASDAVYQWTKTVGGTGNDSVYSTGIDSSGNVYIAGTFQDTVDFDPGSGIDNHTSAGGNDAFLSKYDASGNYQWTKTFGGIGSDAAYMSLAIDSSNSVYIEGWFSSTVDFDPGSGIDNHTSAGGYDAFFSKYDSSGTYQWTKTFGGTENDATYSVVVNFTGDVYVTGYFRGTVDFDPTSATDNHMSAGSNDIFVSKYDATGAYQWTKTVGGTLSDASYFVAVNSTGDVYITGFFNGTADFDPGAGTDNYTSAGGYDAFFSKYDSAGAYQWTKTFGGAQTDNAYSVAVNSTGDVYITGFFNGTVDFDPTSATDNHMSAGSNDIFLSKYDATGAYQWTKTVGGTGYDAAYTLSADASGNVYVGGFFNGTADFDPGVETDNHTSAGSSDAFFSKYDSMGAYQWTKTVGGTGGDASYFFATDSTNLYVSGAFNNTVDFDPSTAVDNHTSNGSDDIALTKFALDSLAPSLSLSGSTLINTPSQTYTATLSDTLAPILSIEYQLDSTSGSWTSCTPDDGTFDTQNETASCPLTNLSEGSHTIYFRTTDTSQNTSTPLSVPLTVDLTAPASSLTQTFLLKNNNHSNSKDSLDKEKKNYTKEQKPKIQGTNKNAKNGTVTFYRKEGRTKNHPLGTASIDANGDWNFQLPKKKEDGTLDYRLVFTDQAGNVSESSSVFQVTRDWKKPDFIAPLPNTIRRNQTITFTASDTLSGIAFYKVSFVALGQNPHWIKQKTDTFTIPKHLPSGSYLFTVRAVDKAGNVREEEREYRVR